MDFKSLAMVLIGIASCYLLVMIFKLYKRNQDQIADKEIASDEAASNVEGDSSSYYYYDSESYDFQYYQSIDG